MKHIELKAYITAMIEKHDPEGDFEYDENETFRILKEDISFLIWPMIEEQNDKYPGFALPDDVGYIAMWDGEAWVSKSVLEAQLRGALNNLSEGFDRLQDVIDLSCVLAWGPRLLLERKG